MSAAPRLTLPAILSLGLALAAPAEANRPRLFIDEAERDTSHIEDPEPWKDSAVTLPPWPAEADLIPFTVDGDQTPLRYYIDEKSLSTNPDGVIRYTLVVEAGGGSRNVSYEGLRCTARGSYRVYAYGARGRFTPAVGEDWQRLPTSGRDGYHKALHGFYLCVPLKMEPRPKKDMVRALRGQLSPRANTGFMTD